MAQPDIYKKTESLPSLFGGEVDIVGRRDMKEVSDYGFFTKKFEPKKTTDDCFTPPAVYDAVCDWVCARCGIDPAKTRITRPFKPGGDYLAEDYSGDCAVIDNPPFSIITKIVRNYQRMGVRFFLFAPHLTFFASSLLRVTRIVAGVSVVYDNGARVPTSFLTNMLGDIAVMTAPDLARAVKNANGDTVKKRKPKYSYPDELITAARLGTTIAHFVPFELAFDEVRRVSSLDSMKGKGIYGGGFLIPSDRAAELRAAVRYDLSEREIEIVKSLSKHEKK